MTENEAEKLAVEVALQKTAVTTSEACAEFCKYVNANDASDGLLHPGGKDNKYAQAPSSGAGCVIC
jgi:hypothetical protein